MALVMTLGELGANLFEVGFESGSGHHLLEPYRNAYSA